MITSLLFVFLSQSPPESQSLEKGLKEAYAAKSRKDYRLAFSLFLQAAEILKDQPNAEPRRVEVHTQAGRCAYSANDFINAERQLKAALVLGEYQVKAEADCALASLLAQTLAAMNRHREGIPLVDKVVEFRRQVDPRSDLLFSALRQKGGYLFSGALWSEQLHFLRIEFKELLDAMPPNPEHLAYYYGDLAWCLTNNGKREESIECMSKAVTILRSNNIKTNEAATIFRRMGRLVKRSKPQESIELLSAAFSILSEIKGSEGALLLVGIEYCEVLFDIGLTKEALLTLEYCSRLASNILTKNDPFPIGLFPRVEDPLNNATVVALLFAKHGHHDRALEIVQRIQGRGLSNQVWDLLIETGGQESRSFAAERLLQTELGEATQVTAAIGLEILALERRKSSDETLSGSEPDRLASLKLKQLQAETSRSRVLAKLKALQERSDARAKRLQSEPRALADVSRFIPSKSLYLGYLLGSAPNIHLVSIDLQGQCQIAQLKVTAHQLREKVNQLRAKLLSRNPSVYDDLRELYTTLVPTTIRKEVEAAESLVITPDGPLWEMPFAALLAGPDSEPYYLGLAKPIVITPSLSLYGMAQEAGKQKKAASQVTASIIGDPLFSAKGENQLAASGERAVLWAGDKAPPQLPGTKKEAEAIASLYGTQAVTGDKATETLVRTQLKSAQILHIATHGYVNNDYPMASGLLLAAPKSPPSNPSGDGALLAWEVFQSPSSSPHLVVLSACETGLGRSLRAEGVDGLVRSFQVSGVPSIISSLWKVDDESTSLLMTELHRQVRAGKPYHEAVRQAMIAVYSKPETQEPYFWAPFFLVGDQTNRLFVGGQK